MPVVYSVLGPGGYPRPPYGSFAGKVAAAGKVYTQTFSVLGPGGYSRPPYGSFASKVGAAPTAQGASWDTSDPIFYDWWRKRAQDERRKLAVVEVIESVADTISEPPLREQTIAAIEVASSIDELRSLNLLTYELNALKAAIADYQQFLDEDEEEAAILLLMH